MFDKSYKLYLAAKGTRQSTIDDVQGTIKQWNLTVGIEGNEEYCRMEIDAITDEIVWNFTAVNLARNISPNTVRKYLRNIKGLLRHAVKKKWLVTMPDIIMPDEILRNAEDTFTIEEVKRLLKATSMFEGRKIVKIDGACWWTNLITIIYNTAVRSGTALLMEFDWVRGRQLTIRKLPGIKSNYIVPLNDEAICAIGIMRELMERHHQQRIFPWPYRKEYLQRCFKKLCVAAGLPVERQFGFHAIRKHTGSEVAKTNFAAAVKLLGHSDPKVTSRYYLNTEIVCRDAIDAIPKLRVDYDE